jgi:uncharacterized membrane protein
LERRAASSTSAWTDTWPHVAAGALVALYIGTFAWLALLRHASFDSAGFDLGVYDQVVWNTLHGRPFFYTATGQPLLHLSNHASPILLLIAPFYLLYSGPQTLLVLQAAAVGVGGLPLFWLTRERLRSNLAGLSVLSAYLLFPALQVVTLSDFHPPALAVAFLSFAFYGVLRRRAGLTLAGAVLAMACKEQIPLVVVTLGLYALAAQRAWRLGLALVGMGALWFVAVMYWVIPAFSVTGDHIFLEYYAALGSTPLEIVTTAVSNPALVVETLWQPEKLRYLRDLLAPFAGLPLVGLPALLVGLPALGVNLLSANPAMYDATRGHYAADVAPWLAWGAALGMITLLRAVGRVWPAGRRAATVTVSGVLLGVALVWQVLYGYSPLAPDAPRWQISEHDRLAQRFLAQIPPDASVAAQGELYPHVSRRMIAYHLPDVNDADYVWVDVAASTQTMHPNDLKRSVDSLLEWGEFGVLDAADGYLLLRRGWGAPNLPDEFYDFARVSAPAPQYPVQVDFDGQLRLLGFDVLDDPRRGETRVRLYWQALQPVERKARLYPFFLDAQGNLVEDTTQRPLVTQLWYPPRRWDSAETVIATTLPWQLGERWSVGVGVLEGSDWTDRRARLEVTAVDLPSDSPLEGRPMEGGTWVRLGTFERQGRALALMPPADTTAPPPHLLRADLGGRMTLLGYDLSPARAHPGDALAVTLTWQAAAPMGVDFTVFVHLLAEDGRRAAQHDGGPWYDVPLPTSAWREGEVLRDRHLLDLPTDLAPGTYRLRVGAYYWPTGERLPLVVDGVSAGDEVELGKVTVE